MSDKPATELVSYMADRMIMDLEELQKVITLF